MWTKLLGQSKSDRLFERRGLDMNIEISTEEYKELLEIKGKYEEVLRREEAGKKAEPIIWRDCGKIGDFKDNNYIITCQEKM